MKAVILAAGKGTRLQPLTYDRPKHLITVGGKPLVLHLIQSLMKAGIEEILMIVHHKAEMIKKNLAEYEDFMSKIEYCHQPKLLGTADAIHKAKDSVSDDFLVVYGDLLIEPMTIKKVVDFHEREEPAMTIASVFVKNPQHYGVLEIEENNLVNIIEKPPLRKAVKKPVNAGIYVFSKDIFKAINRTKFSPRGEKEITDSILELISEKKSVMTVSITREEWLDVGRPWDLFEANKRVLDNIESDIRSTSEKNVNLDGKIIVEDGVRLRSGSYIEGPVFIGKGSEIGPNCYIRPYTCIGRHVRIGNACEVKNSILLDHVHVGHLSYLGDSIIGEECNLGAGFISANLRFDNKLVRMRIHNSIVESGKRKLGTIMGDQVKTGVGVLTMPGVKIGYNSWIGPNVVVEHDVSEFSHLVLEQSVRKYNHRQSDSSVS